MKDRCLYYTCIYTEYEIYISLEEFVSIDIKHTQLKIAQEYYKTRVCLIVKIGQTIYYGKNKEHHTLSL